MPRYTNGDSVVETSNAIEGVRLKAEGYTESTALTAAVRGSDGVTPQNRSRRAAKKAASKAVAPAPEPDQPDTTTEQPE